jgi:ABC-type Fe3+ transport system permease subunit
MGPGQSYGTPYYGPPPGSDSNDTIILVLGILGLVVCQLLGPVAWVMGKRRLEECRQRGWPDPGLAKAGWILGIIATVYVAFLLLIGVVFLFVALVAGTTS